MASQPPLEPEPDDKIAETSRQLAETVVDFAGKSVRQQDENARLRVKLAERDRQIAEFEIELAEARKQIDNLKSLLAKSYRRLAQYERTIAQADEGLLEILSDDH